MNDVKKEVKIIIVKNNIDRINQQIYDNVIACRVGKKAGDEELTKRATENMIKLEKNGDEYNIILKELESPQRNNG